MAPRSEDGGAGKSSLLGATLWSTAKVAIPFSITACSMGDQISLQGSVASCGFGSEISFETCNELGIEIIKGVLSKDHVHMFLAIPPQHSVSDVCAGSRAARHARSSRNSLSFAKLLGPVAAATSTAGNITQDLILQYLTGSSRSVFAR